VSHAQGDPGERGRGRVGQAGRQRTGRPPSRAARTRQQIRQAIHAASLPSAPEAYGIGKEVTGSPVGDDSTRGTTSGRSQARPDPSQGGEEDGLAALPAQVQTCSHGVYLKRTKDRPDDNFWWCDPETIVALNRRETTCSSAATSRKSNRPRCGQGSRRSRRRGSRSGVWATCWRMTGAARRS